MSEASILKNKKKFGSPWNFSKSWKIQGKPKQEEQEQQQEQQSRPIYRAGLSVSAKNKGEANIY